VVSGKKKKYEQTNMANWWTGIGLTRQNEKKYLDKMSYVLRVLDFATIQTQHYQMKRYA
jgi:hypothetical protein